MKRAQKQIIDAMRPQDWPRDKAGRIDLKALTKLSAADTEAIVQARLDAAKFGTGFAMVKDGRVVAIDPKDVFVK